MIFRVERGFCRGSATPTPRAYPTTNHRMRVWAIRATTGGLPLQRMKQPCLCRGGAPVPACLGHQGNHGGFAPTKNETALPL